MKIIYSQTDESKIRASFQRGFFNRNKNVIKVEENYLPCYLFELRFKSQKKIKSLFVICDSLKGKVRRIKWPQPTSSSAKNSKSYPVNEEEALERVKEEVKWVAFSSGPKLKRKYNLESVFLLGQAGYPFWVVYFKKKGRYNFSIYDGLSGKKEDFFSKEIFLELFGLKKNS